MFIIIFVNRLQGHYYINLYLDFILVNNFCLLCYNKWRKSKIEKYAARWRQHTEEEKSFFLNVYEKVRLVEVLFLFVMVGNTRNDLLE